MKSKRVSKRIFYFVLSLVLLITASASPVLAANKNMYWEKEGVTVKADQKSPTGYTATFVYKDPIASRVMISGDFRYYKPQASYNAATDKWYTPYEWQPGMFPAKNARYEEDMKKIAGTDLWTISLPIPSGSFCYDYKVTNAITNATTLIPDPANIATLSNLNRYPKEHSVVYGLFDKHKQTTDNSVELPRKDSKVGKVSYVPFTDVNGDTKYIGVYLPYGYNSNRTEPYKVIYMSHGTDGDETEWYTFGNVNNIMDNLIAEGKAEPAIVVAIDNNDYPNIPTAVHKSNAPWTYQDGDVSDGVWDYSMINRNFYEKVLPLVEAKYNVSKDSKDRAFAGLSRGGFLTSILYVQHPTDFGYFGIFSGVYKPLLGTLGTYSNIDKTNLYFGYGNYDGVGLANTPAFEKELDGLNINYVNNVVYGAHDWFTWQEIFVDFVQNFVWK